MNRKDTEDFIKNLEKDLKVYGQMWDCIQRRDQEVEGTVHYEHFTAGAGTQAMRHVLNMAIVQCQWLLEVEKKRLKEMPPEGPRLVAVHGGKDD